MDAPSSLQPDGDDDGPPPCSRQSHAEHDAPPPCSRQSHADAASALALLAGPDAARLIDAHVSRLAAAPASPAAPAADAPHALAVALAALDAFLQANVTGPVLPPAGIASVEDRFAAAWPSLSPRPASAAAASASALQQLRRACLAHLDVDGVAPYPHIPYPELFSLARFVLVDVLAGEARQVLEVQSPYTGRTERHALAWLRLRVHVWHYKLLTQPSLGPGSNFAKSSQWSDVPSLTSAILDSMDAFLACLTPDEAWSVSAAPDTWTREERTQFLVEAAANLVMLGRHQRAKDTLAQAVRASGLTYALSGALGKRTRFQDNSISQLVVLARSRTADDGDEAADDDTGEASKPEALKLNDDTLLEHIHFTGEADGDAAKSQLLPASLAALSPDSQPQLSALDQIVLLTEATLRDAFSPVDALTSAEMLPYAVRVLADKSTNWQVYTQALLVRSRIEVHRSRTLERGVLQLQAVADQVLTDTSSSPGPERHQSGAELPAIEVTTPGQEPARAASQAAPTSFLPAPRADESAPAHVRLRYVHALCTPPRWHLESELAYAWAGVGSLASALDIFKRLRLWAEVALCLASAAAGDDEDGRGSGGEAKAKAIIRWRLFHKTGDDASSPSTGPDDEGVDDVMRLKADDYAGPERSPPPPNAARLWCILGDLDGDARHYERAWAVSRRRYARAQRSLGDARLAQKDLHGARAAYRLATAANRLSPDMWARLGDINLGLGAFDEAAEAFSRSIACATDTAGGEGARTWSNLGSALWSLYREATAAPGGARGEADGDAPSSAAEQADADEPSSAAVAPPRSPATLLAQALAAYKKGASIAHDNWRIWDNVLTLASRIRPLPVADMVLACTHVLRIRQTEDAVDADVLAALLHDVVLAREPADAAADAVYEPPRGSPERLVARLVEEDVVPLITHRPELWALASRLRAWRRDYPGAVEASERAWRAAVGAPGRHLAAPDAADAPAAAHWASGDDAAAWADVVRRTDELVAVLQNYGARPDALGPRWRAKARSAVRSVMGRARESWEGSEGWAALEGLVDGLKAGEA